jgi:signal peptidase I
MQVRPHIFAGELSYPAHRRRRWSPLRARLSRWAQAAPARLVRQALMAAVILLLLFAAYGTLNNRWYRVLYVYSGSMVPVFQPGDLIIVTPPPRAIQPGMILTLEVGGQLVTHRVISVQADGRLVTQGDANPAPDVWGSAPIVVRAQYWARIPGLGFVVRLPYTLTDLARGAMDQTAQNIQRRFP